ncbi:MAG: PDZ domain-containing protein [Longimicrobiales bacterium]|nr:PDZ domain-containing protein [Longimicrobiales bacterium]
MERLVNLRLERGVRAASPAFLAAAALLAFGSADASSQDRPRVWDRAAVVERGWIGVSFDISMDRRTEERSVLIVDVSEGSPAAEAGLRAGDRVLAINELRTPRELAALPELLRLEVDDVVTMVVERDGDRRRFRMRAAPRPAGFAPSRRVEVAMRSDSLVDTWSRSMDSLQIHLRAGDGSRDVRVFRSRGSPDPRLPRTAPVASEHRVQVPFEFFVFQGERHDSLRHEMVEVNDMVARLEEQIRDREVELRRRLGSRRSERISDDRELRRLQEQLQSVSARSQRLETAMAEAARNTAGLQYEVVLPEARTVVGGRRDSSPEEFRPLTPYLLGRNLVAGAEVIDLEPQLARYFEVTSGVLVTKVAPGTPADIAGLIPGDVITRMDQVGVRSVEDLRYGVSVAGDTLPLTLVREGASRQVLLRKR